MKLINLSTGKTVNPLETVKFVRFSDFHPLKKLMDNIKDCNPKIKSIDYTNTKGETYNINVIVYPMDKFNVVGMLKWKSESSGYFVYQNSNRSFKIIGNTMVFSGNW